MTEITPRVGAKTWFPERVWDVTGWAEDGKPLWSSRSADFAGYRRNLLRRILERDYADKAELDELKRLLAEATI